MPDFETVRAALEQEQPGTELDRRARLVRRAAVTAVFLVLGATEGAWAARLPAVKADLHLSAGTLGLALLGPALGCVLAMPGTGPLLATVRPRYATMVGLVVLAGLLPVTTLAHSAWQLFLILTVWGAGLGTTDVSMNTEAAALQDQLGRRVMSSFHGAYSVGGLAGSGLGAITAAAGFTARTTFLLTAVIVVVAGLIGAAAFASRPAPAPPAGDGPQTAGPARSRWPQWSWTLIALGLISFASFLGEGSAGNWSAVYLHSSLGAAPALAATGFTVFAGTMTAGRLSGDWLADRLGPVRLVRIAGAVAGAGFGAGLLIGQVWSGLLGFALLGAGLSVVVPLAFTAAAAGGVRAGPNLALVTSCGYLGALAGPALIGGLADATSLPLALGIVVLLGVMIVLMAGTVRSTPGQSTYPDL